MTYGRVRYVTASGPFESAAVSHSAELVRGDFFRGPERPPHPPFGHLLPKGRRDLAAPCGGASLPQPFEQGRHVHLVGLVVAGQRVHDDVDAGAEGHLALALATGHHRVERLIAVVERPSSGEIVGGDQDRADAVDAPSLPALIAVARGFRLDPQLPAVPT